jgi:hypothetical protein
MKAAVLNLLEASRSKAFLRFLRNYRARRIEDVSVPSSPEEALRIGYEMGYQQGHQNGLREGVDLGVDVGMEAAVARTGGTFDPSSIM